MALELGIEVKTDLNEEQLKAIPNFQDMYEKWYSEAVACIRQLLPDRLEDFTELYKPSKSRKDITWRNYTISDYLRGLTVTRGFEKAKIVGPDAAFPPLRQQAQIIEALRSRFESALFEIRALVQGDFFDDELASADELNAKGYHRAAGAIAGVVLGSGLID